MKTEHLHQQYNDLLPANADHATVRVVNDLHTMYASAATPAHVNDAVARAVQQRKAAQEQRPVRRHGVFGGWQLRTVAVVAALLLAMLAGGTYALAPLLDRAVENFNTDQGLQYIEQAGLWKEVNLSQTINDYTIHLQRVYADANRVVVGYTIDGPEGQAQYNFYGVDKETITTASGTVLPWYYGGEAVWDIRAQRSTQAMLMMFDAAALRDAPAELSLRLDIGEIHVYTKDTPIVAATAEELQPAHVVTGPFTFNFAVPFRAGGVVQLDQTVLVDTPSITATRPLDGGGTEVTQTVAAGAVPITLERVVVAPSETRAYLRFPVTEGIAAEDLTAFATFKGDGWTSKDLATIIPGWMPPEGLNEDGLSSMRGWTDADGRYVLSFHAPLHEKHGEWTVTIPEIQGVDRTTEQPDGSAGTKTITGPWEFTFIVP